ncbi:O-antigen polymerase [Microcoleus sp. S13_C5]|uniref:O-antigen polymerase n=1 Tax=Microcoleus sp. S13_C5 TaxID=3055411 RepID=UPI002FD30B1D
MIEPIFRRQAAYKNSCFISFFLSILILAEFLPRSEQFFHWFVIPVTLSGILIGIDAVDWFRGRLNIFDPVGILGLLGFHFFFLAPLLHVRWDAWVEPWYTPPSDWRPWLGYMALLNFFGICIYRLSRSRASLPNKHQLNRKKIRTIDPKRFPLFISIALLISAVLQVFTYQKFGGVMAYINAATSNDTESNQFQGMGILFLVSESFPILALIGFAVYAQKYKRLRTLPVLIGVLIVFFVLQMFFGGLRGSRANTIWALFWALGIIHFWLRKVSKKEIAVGLVLLVFFMYFYGFFKGGGIDGFQNALEDRSAAEEKSGRSWKGLLLGDLGRSDVQAFVLYRIVRYNSDYEYAWGRTYFAATTILIPGAILPNKPPNKSMEGTNVMSGMGSYNPQEPGKWVASKVYGLAGETMLNFGPLPVPFTFIVLGIIVGRVKRCLVTWDSSDIRLVLLPMMVNFCFIVLVSDLDNDIFFLFKNAGFPVLVLWSSSKIKVIDCEDKSRFSSPDTQQYLAPNIHSKFQD